MREKSSHLLPSQSQLGMSNVKNHGLDTEASALGGRVLRMCSNKGRALVLARNQAALSTILALVEKNHRRTTSGTSFQSQAIFSPTLRVTISQNRRTVI
jgi:hypothetical protein